MAPIISTFGSGSARGFGRAQFVLKELFAFTTATFTPGSNTGRFGPSLTQARSGLSGPEVNDWKNDTAFFNTSNGIQIWTVPADGTYRITARGSWSGNTSSNAVIGRGAIIRGDFSLTEGQQLRILVGQAGSVDTNGSHNSTGGGGGSFVVNSSGVPFIVAGGACGLGYSNDTNSLRASDGLTSTSGSANAGGSGPSQGGVNGSGGQTASGRGGGGGGFTGNGDDAVEADGGESFQGGGLGGSSDQACDGGFGAGGATVDYLNNNVYSGGGGGYSGGAAGTYWDDGGDRSGGGGGSFIRSGVSNPATSDGNWTITGNEPHTAYSGSVADLNSFNSSEGSVTIEKLTTV